MSFKNDTRLPSTFVYYEINLFKVMVMVTKESAEDQRLRKRHGKQFSAGSRRQNSDAPGPRHRKRLFSKRDIHLQMWFANI